MDPFQVQIKKSAGWENHYRYPGLTWARQKAKAVTMASGRETRVVDARSGAVIETFRLTPVSAAHAAELKSWGVPSYPKPNPPGKVVWSGSERECQEVVNALASADIRAAKFHQVGQTYGVRLDRPGSHTLREIVAAVRKYAPFVRSNPPAGRVFVVSGVATRDQKQALAIGYRHSRKSGRTVRIHSFPSEAAATKHFGRALRWARGQE